MLNIYNKINLKKTSRKEKKEIESNILYLYFDEENLKSELIIKATKEKTPLNKEVLNNTLEKLEKNVFLKEIYDDLYNINHTDNERTDNPEDTKEYLCIENLFGIPRGEAAFISGNNTLTGGTKSVNTANISTLYVSSEKIKVINESLSQSIKILLNKISENIKDDYIEINKDNNLYKFKVEDEKEFYEFMNKYNDGKINFNLNIENLEEKSSILIFFNLPGLTKTYNVKKGREDTNNFIRNSKIGIPMKKETICNVCLTKQNLVYNLKSFYAPNNKEKAIRNFNLNGNENGSGYICIACMNKVKEVNEHIINLKSRNVFIDDISGEIISFYNAEDILKYKSDKSLNLNIGGTIYNYIKKDDNSLYPIFERDFYLKSNISKVRFNENLNYLNDLLYIYNKEGEREYDIFTEVKKKDTPLVKNNFEVFKKFLLNDIKIPLYVYKQILDSYLNDYNKLEKPVFFYRKIFNFNKECFSIMNKNINLGDLMIEDILYSAKEKLANFMDNDELNLTDEESVVLAGKLIRELDSLSNKSEKNLTVFRDVQKNKKGVIFKINELTNKYAHELNNSKKTQIFSKIIISLENSNLNKTRFELLFNIGFLTTDLTIIYLKTKKGE